MVGVRGVYKGQHEEDGCVFDCGYGCTNLHML